MRLVILLFMVAFASAAPAEIYDAGTFHSGKIPVEVNTAKLGPDLTPKRFGHTERFASAPVGKPLYVIGEDRKCYWGNFAKNNGNEVLLVYYLSPVSNEHCVYQQKFAPKPSGYSVTVRDGGTCVPTEASVEGEKDEWVVTQLGEAVSFATCFNNMVSYGDNIDPKHQLPVAVEKVRAAFPRIVAEKEIVKSSRAIMEVVPEAVAPQVVKEEVVKSQAPKRQVAKHQVVKPQVPPRKPSSIDKKAMAITGGFTLQLSSHLSATEAASAVESLKGHGIEAFQFQGMVSGKTRYRVCTGHFTRAKEARDFQASLNAKGVNQSFVQMLPK